MAECSALSLWPAVSRRATQRPATKLVLVHIPTCRQHRDRRTEQAGNMEIRMSGTPERHAKISRCRI
jgi:hypothetical protein